MGSAGRRGLSRRQPRREPRIKITIFCEGELTEPDYLRRFASAHGMKLNIAKDKGKPGDLVREAIAAKRASRSEDFSGPHAIWAIFDCDDHPRVSETRRLAKDNGVQVAYSEPCFEVWALLHFVDGMGPMNSARAIDRLCEYIPSYKRVKRLDVDALRPGYEAAVRSAYRLRQARHQDGTTKPYTDVDILLELIRANGRL